MKFKKYSGEVVSYDRKKLIHSLVHAGAPLDIAKQIINEVEHLFFDGITSKQIFNIAFKKIKLHSKAHAARYNLKNGIQKLGPAGYYFEKFIARIFELQGYKTSTNVFLDGKCVSHELDVLIKKDKHVTMVECKFHGSQEAKTDVKVPMYILSRYNDLKNNSYAIFEQGEQITKCWIVTNNKFTEDAIKFGVCSQLNLLSWNYPLDKSLKDLVNQYHVYPVTCLTTLTQAEKEILLIENILTVYDFVHFRKKNSKLKLSQTRLNNVLKECSQLLNY